MAKMSNEELDRLVSDVLKKNSKLITPEVRERITHSLDKYELLIDFNALHDIAYNIDYDEELYSIHYDGEVNIGMNVNNNHAVVGDREIITDTSVSLFHEFNADYGLCVYFIKASGKGIKDTVNVVARLKDPKDKKAIILGLEGRLKFILTDSQGNTIKCPMISVGNMGVIEYEKVASNNPYTVRLGLQE